MGNLLLNTISMGALLALGAGSAGASSDHRDVEAQVAVDPATETGSLWSEAGYQNFLYYDQKAKNVGDLLTIRIVETAQASRSATTTLDRESGIDAGVSAMLGLESKVVDRFARVTPSALVGTSTSSRFKGDGATKSSGSLTAAITCRVVEVLSNGNLVVFGKQEVKINHELQILTLRGIVRPRDIEINNVILSTYVADAKIEYSGIGVVSDKQQPGWLSRSMDKVWPF